MTYEPLDMDTVELTAKKYMAMQGIGAGLVEALGVDAASDFVGTQLATYLTTELLTEQGRTVTRDVTWTTHQQPRWMPYWLWKRIPTREVTYTMEVTPAWGYPRCERILGPAQRYAYTTGGRS